MDPKTREALALLYELTQRVIEIEGLCGLAIDDLNNLETGRLRLSYTRGCAGRAMWFLDAPSDSFVSLDLTGEERKALGSVLISYRNRISSLLEGCSLKVSPLAKMELDEYRALVGKVRSSKPLPDPAHREKSS